MVSVPVKPVQYQKALMPIVVTEFGMVKDPVNLEFVKASAPNETKELPRVSEPVKPVQFLKAPMPISVTEFWIIKLSVKLEHPKNR